MTLTEKAILRVHHDSLQTLRSLPVGARAWCWMTDEGIDGQPVLVVVAQSEDPEGARFQKRVGRCIGYSASLGAIAHGTVRRGEKHVVFLSRNTPAHVLDIHAALCGLSTLEGLPTFVAVQMKGTAMVSRAVGLNLALTTQALASGRGAFYLLIGQALREPRLLIASNAVELRAMVHAQKSGLNGKMRGIHGEFRRSSQGYLVFRTMQNRPELLGELAAWTARHRRRWPELSVMDGARLVISDETGSIRSRHKDETLWRKAS